MARRSDHSREEIKEMAIRAAIRILESQGRSGLSTRRVAREIGYTVGTLYLVFANLDALILEVNAATLDELHEQLIKARGQAGAPRTALQAMAQTYLAYANEHHSRWSLLFSHHMSDGVVPAWFDEKVSSLFELIGQPLAQIRPDLDERQRNQASRELWSGVHGACDLGLNDKLSFGISFSPQAVLESLVGRYLSGFEKL